MIRIFDAINLAYIYPLTHCHSPITHCDDIDDCERDNNNDGGDDDDDDEGNNDESADGESS